MIAMKRIFTALFLLAGIHLSAQNLTGIWRGTFSSKADMLMGFGSSRYEVQIDDSKQPLNNMKGVGGVAYSYQNTRFYGKASTVGVWSPGQKNLVFEENKLLDYRFSDGSDNDIYLFTCYLTYRKEGDKEVLEGTYTSKHYKNGRPGDGGRIYLERVVDTDFEKEEFLKKKEEKLPETKQQRVKPGAEDALIKKQPAVTTKPPVKKPVTSTKPPVASVKPPVKKPVTTTKPPVIASKPPVKKPVTQPPVVKNNPQVTKPPVNVPENKPDIVKADKPVVKVPEPKVLKERENELIQTIYTDAKEIVVDLYDNGEVDGDTISVYDNNRLIAANKGLSTKPVSITVRLDEDDAVHEIVMVALNLGSIPPNTALMIVQAGNQRYTVRLSSTESKNAMVRFKYRKDLKD